MTEKRFIRLSATRIKDTKTGENHICYITLFNEITKICDENEQLKKELKSFRPLYFKSEDGCVTLYEKVIE